MLRIIFTILVSIPAAITFLWQAHQIKVHSDEYTEEQKYEFIQHFANMLANNARIQTIHSGEENLPAQGGYIMYPNHQGKYDAVGILINHAKPCTVVMEERRSHLPLATQLITVLDGTRLDRSSRRAQLDSILQIIDNVKAGKRYILFPEGGYGHNQNNVRDFLPGSFKCALRSKCPVVPVALIDSYKPFGRNSLRKVTTQVHFLKPITYAEYEGMTSQELAAETRRRIVEKIQAVLSSQASAENHAEL